jgi:hypothetical protein
MNYEMELLIYWRVDRMIQLIFYQLENFVWTLWIGILTAILIEARRFDGNDECNLLGPLGHN